MRTLVSVSARRLRKPALALAVFAAIAVTLTACAYLKPGSLQVTQPGEIGSVRIHMVFCSAISSGVCAVPSESEEGQTFLAIAVPKGTIAPDTFAAVAEPPSGPPLVFRRNQSAAEALGRLKAEGTDPPWPPAGSELIGYLSDVMPGQEGEKVEWTVNPEFGLPVPADGGPYGGAFLVALAIGQRNADGKSPTDLERPAYCPIGEEESTREECTILKDARVELRPTDVRVKAGAAPTVTIGREATIPFTVEVGTTATNIPTFVLGATTNLPGVAPAVSDSSYVPSPPIDASRRTSTSRSVKVAVPENAKPGTYSVTLTAKTPAGGSVSQTGSFTVTKAEPAPPAFPRALLTFGKTTFDKAKGTATIAVQVGVAGKLTATGKKIVKAVRNATAPRTVNLTIRARGKAKKKLNKTGKTTVKATIAFVPKGGTAVSQVRSLTLKKNLSK